LRLTPDDAVVIRGGAFWGGFLFFLLIEYFDSYRTNTVSKKARVATNLSVAVLNGALLNLLFWSATVSALLRVEGLHVGLLNMMDIPYWSALLLTVVFMDLVMYVWHLLNHVVPILWRFHRVHHSDINMDVSTASRFHIGELSISAVIKIATVYFFGADIASVVLFECILIFAAQFQHSSIKIPEWFERAYWLFFVPPSMHRIHHSVVIRERNTNYGTIFSVWDRILGTLLRDVEQERIVIGLGPYRSPDKLTIGNLLVMPFTRPVR
jgi:sterol desaturase/sphingolipid hydroxylase (fatty acid hydroxylase superfamily)